MPTLAHPNPPLARRRRGTWSGWTITAAPWSAGGRWRPAPPRTCASSRPTCASSRWTRVWQVTLSLTPTLTLTPTPTLTAGRVCGRTRGGAAGLARAWACGRQGGTGFWPVGAPEAICSGGRFRFPAPDRAPGCPEPQVASANQLLGRPGPLGPRWPAISACLSRQDFTRVIVVARVVQIDRHNWLRATLAWLRGGDRSRPADPAVAHDVSARRRVRQLRACHAERGVCGALRGQERELRTGSSLEWAQLAWLQAARCWLVAWRGRAGGDPSTRGRTGSYLSAKSTIFDVTRRSGARNTSASRI